MISRSDITNEEYSFLAQHKIHWENLYDARGLHPTGWDDAAKEVGLDFGLAEACYLGHRLRDRKGHCIQCNTANIAFLRRSSAKGFVYIAASKKEKIYKVGSTIDYKHRGEALRREKYAGCGDWRVICVCMVNNSGKIEFEIHDKLKEYKSPRKYQNSGIETTASETFEASLVTVWQAYQESVNWRKLPDNKKDRVSNFSAFEFSGK